MRAVLVRAEVRHLWRYFPRQLEGTRNWLKQGLISGTSDSAKLHFTGPLDKFPFKDRRDGIFEIRASVRDAAVRIGEEWPLIEGVSGEFLLDGDRIDITPRSGTIMGADVSQSKVSILDIGQHEVRLSVDGEATGQVDQYLRFVANSPVADTQKALRETCVAKALLIWRYGWIYRLSTLLRLRPKGASICRDLSSMSTRAPRI